ncbi:MAG: TIGR04255 family protein [Moraxellaceae bacterium]
MFHPVSEKHAISKVIAVLHLPQEVLLVNDLYNKLNDNQRITEKYQKRGTTISKTIQIENNQVKVLNEVVPNGFILEEFNEAGHTKNLLKLENITGSNKAQLTFECNEYDRWSGFIERLLLDITEVNNHSKLYIEAISLTYLDEFDITDKENINLDLLFKFENDKNLEKLKHTYNGGITNFTQSQFDKSIGQSEERTEIFLNKDINRVSIVHTCAHRFAEVQLFNSKSLSDQFNKEHLKNKEVLKELLIDEVLVQIGIN